MLRNSWIALGPSKLRFEVVLGRLGRSLCGFGRLGRSLALLGAALVLCLSGCIPGPFLRPDDTSSCPCHSTEPADSKSDSSSNSKEQPPEKNGKTSPRTLPQAMSAYWHCLRTHGQETNDKKEEKTSENDTSNGASPDKDKEAQNKEGKDDGSSEEKKENNNSNDEKKNGKEDEKKNGKEEAKESWISIHAQATSVTQTHDAFRSPYIGPRSLLPVETTPTSVTATLFLDGRLWETDGWSGELVFNPELSSGPGLSDSQGIAGFPNGEITRVGIVSPTPYFARWYLRQTLGFGGEQEKVEDEANQIAGKRDINRFTLSVGKFAATDFADDNQYSHDPRTQFLPWSIMYNGAWDYPANVRGYTYGIATDFNTKYWALRYGVFAEPTFANGAPLDPKFLKANGQVLEWLLRYGLDERPGNLRLLTYAIRAHMGDYLEALQQMPVNPDVTLTRAYRWKYGFGLSWDQEITKQLGMFARLGWNDGHTESWAFTAIDRLAEIGVLLKGKCWCRPNDVIGLAGCIEGLSGDHRNYLGAGGLDFIIGDGKLTYGPEEIFEFFYNFQLAKGIFVAFDFQEVNHPAYNRDRGPVSIYSLRVHLEI
jgi:high affinity Mn2+ porin